MAAAEAVAGEAAQAVAKERVVQTVTVVAVAAAAAVATVAARQAVATGHSARRSLYSQYPLCNHSALNHPDHHRRSHLLRAPRCRRHQRKYPRRCNLEVEATVAACQAEETSRSARRNLYSRSRLCSHLAPSHRDHRRMPHRRSSQRSRHLQRKYPHRGILARPVGLVAAAEVVALADDWHSRTCRRLPARRTDTPWANTTGGSIRGTQWRRMHLPGIRIWSHRRQSGCTPHRSPTAHTERTTRQGTHKRPAA